MASAEELEFLKSSHEKKKIKKTGLLVFVLVLVVAALAGSYYAFLYRPPEKLVSWPKNEAGTELSEYAKMENCPYINDMQLKYPDIPGAKVAPSAGKIVVTTALGKYRDVPLHLILEYFQESRPL